MGVGLPERGDGSAAWRLLPGRSVHLRGRSRTRNRAAAARRGHAGNRGGFDGLDGAIELMGIKPGSGWGERRRRRSKAQPPVGAEVLVIEDVSQHVVSPWLRASGRARQGPQRFGTPTRSRTRFATACISPPRGAAVPPGVPSNMRANPRSTTLWCSAASSRSGRTQPPSTSREQNSSRLCCGRVVPRLLLGAA